MLHRSDSPRQQSLPASRNLAAENLLLAGSGLVLLGCVVGVRALRQREATRAARTAILRKALDCAATPAAGAVDQESSTAPVAEQTHTEHEQTPARPDELAATKPESPPLPAALPASLPGALGKHRGDPGTRRTRIVQRPRHAAGRDPHVRRYAAWEVFSALAAMFILCGALLAVGDGLDAWDLPAGVYVMNAALTLSALLCAAAFTTPTTPATSSERDQH